MKENKDRYITLHFSQIHNVEKMEKEYKAYDKFFAANYKKELPRSRRAKILDVGCGLGETLYSLYRLGYRNVTGIDCSRECVDFCNNKGYAKCHMADARSYFDACGDTYDVIFFNDIIEHFQLEDVVYILTGMRKHLNEGGVILAKTMNAANALLATATLYGDLTHKMMFDEFSLREVFMIAGFERKKVKVKGSNLYCFYWNPLNYIAWGGGKTVFNDASALFCAE